MGYLIPYERWTLRSPLSASEALSRLDALVACQEWRWPWKRCDSPFQGSLQGRRFTIERANTRNTHLPVIVGEVRDDPAGSRLEITFRLRKLTIAFLALISMLAAPGFFAAEAKLSGVLYFAAFILLGNAIGFVPEVRKAKALLSQALGPPGRPVSAPISPTSWLEGS